MAWNPNLMENWIEHKRERRRRMKRSPKRRKLVYDDDNDDMEDCSFAILVETRSAYSFSFLLFYFMFYSTQLVSLQSTLLLFWFGLAWLALAWYLIYSYRHTIITTYYYLLQIILEAERRQFTCPCPVDILHFSTQIM